MVTSRRYYGIDDYHAISAFIHSLYRPYNRDGNWLQPIWAYMHSHPNLDWGALGRIRIWEDHGHIVAVAHYEMALGEAFFQVHPDYAALKPDLLDYAIADLASVEPDGSRSLRAFISDFDTDFTRRAASLGFTRDPANDRTLSVLETPAGFAPDLRLPEGYRLISLAEDNDLAKMHRVLWRGFDHAGEPPVEGIVWRKQMQSSPFFRPDLTLAVEAPNGDWASFCGMWFEAPNRIALVEPVATDPVYRRLGLGRAVVLEGVRRCAALGARLAFVGSDQAFYHALGFKTASVSQAWSRRSRADGGP